MTWTKNAKKDQLEKIVRDTGTKERPRFIRLIAYEASDRCGWEVQGCDHIDADPHLLASGYAPGATEAIEAAEHAAASVLW